MGGSGTAISEYEELRCRVLTAAGACDCDRGQIFLLRGGIVAWIARGTTTTTPTNPTTDRQSDATAPAHSDEIHAGMVRVLANMALAAGRREMTT
jgi:3-mercaptopyruvate sulfurtransferase SseA